jgi:hypothetical protein
MMKVVIVAGLLIIAAATILAVERDAIIAGWTAIYPSDPIMKTALQLCYIEDRQFNRLSSASRKNCYDKWLPIFSAVDRSRSFHQLPP